MQPRIFAVLEACQPQQTSGCHQIGEYAILVVDGLQECQKLVPADGLDESKLRLKKVGRSLFCSQKHHCFTHSLTDGHDGHPGPS